MRKHFFTVGLLILPFSALTAQDLPIDKESGKVTYTEVVEMPGISKSDLYLRCATWFAANYGSSKAVLQLSDKEDGKLMGKALTEVAFKNPPMGLRYGGIVNYTITVQVKDDKYRYIVTDLFHDSGSDRDITAGGALENAKKPKGTVLRGLSGQGGFPSQKQWEQIREYTDQKMKDLVDSLKKGMSKSDSDF